LENIREILEGYAKAAGKCPNICHQPLGEEPDWPSGCQQKHGNFHSFPLTHYISDYTVLIKNQRHIDICSKLSMAPILFFSIISYLF
jgi:hypothetical protein